MEIKTMKVDICDMCNFRDFGVCTRERHIKEELKYEHRDNELARCSGFSCCKEYVERRYKLKEKQKEEALDDKQLKLLYGTTKFLKLREEGKI